MPVPVTVVGAGVMGLSCAVRLARAGHPVEVVTRDLPGETTSAVAGGLWLPYLVEPVDRVALWGRATLVELLRLHAGGVSPVLLRDGLLLHPTQTAVPAWAESVTDLTGFHAVRDPAPGHPHGFALRVPLVDMPRYLPWLVDQLVLAGGRLRQDDLDALPVDGVVVNTSGLSARTLVADALVHPVRGQVVVMDNPGLTRWLSVEDAQGSAESQGSAETELTYVFPRRDDVVVGGSATADDWRTEPDAELARRILTRARALVPELDGAGVRSHRVGLRPARAAVRLEAERHERGTTIHCYGHGGAGVTLSWGCADDVLDLVRTCP